MANNRMFIACPPCKALCMIGKYYPSCMVGIDKSVDTISEFMNDHRDCEGHGYSMSGPTHFRLMWEADDYGDYEVEGQYVMEEERPGFIAGWEEIPDEKKET